MGKNDLSVSQPNIVGLSDKDAIMLKLREADKIIRVEESEASRLFDEAAYKKEYYDRMGRYNKSFKECAKLLAGVSPKALDCLDPKEKLAFENILVEEVQNAARRRKVKGHILLWGLFTLTVSITTFLAYWVNPVWLVATMFGGVFSTVPGCLFMESPYEDFLEQRKYLLEHEAPPKEGTGP